MFGVSLGACFVLRYSDFGFPPWAVWGVDHTPYANNHGAKIINEVEGEGPPLVTLHGFTGGLESWREQGYAAALNKNYRLIFFYIRAHGKSDKPHLPRPILWSDLWVMWKRSWMASASAVPIVSDTPLGAASGSSLPKQHLRG